MDMMAAGTRAPITMAEKATPANQLGKISRNMNGSASWAFESCALTWPVTPGVASAT